VTAVSAVDQTTRHTSAEYLDRCRSLAGMKKTPGEVCTAQARQLVRDGYEPLLKLPEFPNQRLRTHNNQRSAPIEQSRHHSESDPRGPRRSVTVSRRAM
jgi:hypothetical protein